MSRTLFALLASASTLLATPARATADAQPPPATPAPLAFPAPPPPLPSLAASAQRLPTGFVFGVQMAPLLGGSLSVSQGRSSDSGPMATAGGLNFFFESRINDYLSLGPGLQMAFNIVPQGLSGFAAESDVALRLRIGFPASGAVYPYILLAPALAVFVPEGGDPRAGFNFTGGGGIAVRVGTTAALSLELGYRVTLISTNGAELRWGYFAPQLGFQTTF